MVRLYKILTFLLLVFLFVGCKGSKAVVGNSNANAALSAASIIASHKAAAPKFNTLASRVQVV